MALKDAQKLIKGTMDEKLEVIEELTTKRLCRLLKSKHIPETFEDIVTEVTLKRFNRIGQEGMTSYGQDGESLSFPDSDFDEYAQEIYDYREENGHSKRGMVTFF